MVKVWDGIFFLLFLCYLGVKKIVRKSWDVSRRQMDLDFVFYCCSARSREIIDHE